MPSWNQILDEVKKAGSVHDEVRRKYLKRLQRLTKRNAIAYYSGWLQKPELAHTEHVALSDNDKNGFMTVMHGLDRSQGLDLMLHTPGGDIAATQSLVEYLHAMFPDDFRVVVPQLAMSAGTMIACASDRILMGKHSSLGPTDPQIGGWPAHGFIEEFERACEAAQDRPHEIPIWQTILGQYPATLLGECEKAIEWADELVEKWLRDRMFRSHADAAPRAETVRDHLCRHQQTKSHNRHIGLDEAQALGLCIERLEDDDKLQDAVLSVHHAFILTLGSTGAVKIIQNHLGQAFVMQTAPG